MGKTVQVLLTQIQEYVFEQQDAMNLVEGCGQTDTSAPGHMWNFPGLRKNVVSANLDTSRVLEENNKQDQDKSINEILMLQQRTLLQVSKIKSNFYLINLLSIGKIKHI